MIQILFLLLRHRLLAPYGEAGGLVHSKRRFRTSVFVNQELRNFQTHSRQMTTEASRGTFLYTLLLYSSYWRGLTALSILCELGNAKAFGSRMDRRTDTYAFFVL